MATITSTTSGNFNATATWVGGVVPVDGDSFVIAAGHTVTYNVTSPVTNGFNDSDIYGILQSQANASTVLRMNGRLRIRTAGTYHARAGHKLQFKGTAADSHILYLVEESGASLIMEGSDGMPTTTLSATANERSTSFAFTSATNFAAGEWFAIYDHTTAQTGNAGASTLRDEGFWVHDISTNTVYFRQFVGPASTISASAGSTITVANAKVFRVGQILIFGTGANRNVLTVTAINYSTNVITFNSSVTGTVTGLTVYETGSDKIHTSGNKVRKVATITTASSAAAATTITVANANMFTAGDEIWIEARSECGGTTDRAYNAYGTDNGPRYRHVISSVSSNTITLNAQIGYIVVSGALVTRLTRDVIVEPVTPNTDYYGVWAGYLTNYNRKLIVKDVFFRYVGSAQGQPEGGVTFRGYFSTNSPAVTLTNTVPAWSQQCWTEGITLTGSDSTRDLGGLWNYNNRYGQFRCCTVVGVFNSGILPGWYDGGNAAYNCISSGSNAWGYRVEGLTEWSEFSYNYLSRSYWGTRSTHYDGNCGFHHNVIDAITEGPQVFSGSNIPFYKYKVTGGYYGPQNERTTVQYLYSVIQSVSGIPNVFAATPGTYQRGYYHHGQADRGDTGACVITSVEDNFEYDRVRQFVYGTERWWDLAEGAWRVVNASDFTDWGRGWYQTVYVPPNVSLVARCALKLVPGFVGTYPSLTIYSSQSGTGVNRLENAGGNWSSVVSGGSEFAQYTSGAANIYETKEITLSAKAFPRWVQVGIFDTNADASEGWWMKPVETILSADYVNPAVAEINRGPGQQFEEYIVAATGIDKRIRIGGRLK